MPFWPRFFQLLANASLHNQPLEASLESSQRGAVQLPLSDAGDMELEDEEDDVYDPLAAPRLIFRSWLYWGCKVYIGVILG